jgi:hypothetical protein
MNAAMMTTNGRLNQWLTWSSDAAVPQQASMHAQTAAVALALAQTS